MDIMMPGIDEQPAPAPWLAFHKHTDVPRLIGDLLRQNPQASLEEVAAELRQRHAELPRDVVADLMQRCRPAGK